MSGYGLFSELFADDIARHIEFSISSDPESHGTMLVGAGESFFRKVLAYLAHLPWAKDWTRRLVPEWERLDGKGLFFKVDWRSGVPTRVTVYIRRFRLTEGEQLLSGRYGYRGTSRVAELLGCDPVILSTRVDHSGAESCSIYFQPIAIPDVFMGQIAPPLLFECGLPDSPSIRRELPTLYSGTWTSHKGGVVAIKPIGASDDSVANVGFYPAHVEIDGAARLVAMLGGTLPVGRLVTMARAMRLTRLSYFGLEVQRTEVGWKAYLASSMAVPGSDPAGLILALPSLRTHSRAAGSASATGDLPDRDLAKSTKWEEASGRLRGTSG